MLDGRRVKVPALEGPGTSSEGIEYEVMYTSGGGTLSRPWKREKKTTGETRIAYKTIRYPGHFELMVPCSRTCVWAWSMPILGPGEVRSIARDGHPRQRGRPHAPGRGGRLRQRRRHRQRRHPATDHFKLHRPATTMFARVLAGDRAHHRGGGVPWSICRQGRLPPRPASSVRKSARSEMFNQSLFGLAYENPDAIEPSVRARTETVRVQRPEVIGNPFLSSFSTRVLRRTKHRPPGRRLQCVLSSAFSFRGSTLCPRRSG